MENASKALIMAATVLLGLMIISVGVALFSSFSDFSKDTLDKVEKTKIAEWNNNFLKYYGTVSTYDKEKGKYIDKPIEVTAHDIVTVANLAKQNNEKYELADQTEENENTYYVRVVVRGKDSNSNFPNFEKANENEKNAFLKANALIENKDKNNKNDKITYNTKYYTCKEVKISEVTKRIYYIEFVEL